MIGGVLDNLGQPAKTGKVCMKRVRRALVLTMLLLFGWAGLVTSSSPVQAARHSTAGTYQLFYNDQPEGIVVLFRGGGVLPWDTAHWSIHKGAVTATAYGPVLPPATCLRYGQGYACQESNTITGPKTLDGIASRSHPGLWTTNANSAVMSFGTFYAVRTGGFPRG
jgi:hypothetical protein